LTGLDYWLTLAGQAKEYWAGNHTRVKEGDPLLHALLAWHPMAFIAVNAALTLVFVGLILLTPRIVAAIFSIMVSLLHWAGASTWLVMGGYRHGRELSWGVAALMIICLVVGLGWGWRARSPVDSLGESRLSFGVRWTTVAVLFVLWLAPAFLDTNVGLIGKAWPSVLFIYCVCVYLRELKQRKLSALPANPAAEPPGTAPASSGEQ
jgi:hypothetical protein